MFFFIIDTPTTVIYTLSLHDALPIYGLHGARVSGPEVQVDRVVQGPLAERLGGEAAAARGARQRLGRLVELCADRKSTRLNSSHANISYAVFCLKKKKKTTLEAMTHQ